MFKVGDWVELDTPTKPLRPFKVLEVNDKNTKVFLDTKESPRTDNWWNAAICKPWQPKEGEWVVFATKDEKDVFAVFKYGDKFIEEIMSIGDDTVVEPFIGELPSFLKENR